MRDQDASPDRNLIGRRTLTRGVAWSVPVVSLAVAAPALAASTCKLTTGTLAWSAFTQDTNQLGKKLATAGGTGVSVTVTASGDTGASGNGNVTQTGAGVPVLAFYSVTGKANTAQSIRIDFGVAVQNVSFTMVDIDSSIENGTSQYQDLVTITTPGWSGVKHSGILATSDGTSAKPYRALTTDTPAGSGVSTGNVDLSWSSALSAVTFTYGQAGAVYGDPVVAIKDISFQICV